jgi:hypothetical protein
VLPADDQVIFLSAMTARATHLLTGVVILPPGVYLRG